MKVNEYRVLSECVENGVQAGYVRAHKYVETPDEQELKKNIYDAVMLEICEYFDFQHAVDDEET